jgi:hypothetical protein
MFRQRWVALGWPAVRRRPDRPTPAARRALGLLAVALVVVLATGCRTVVTVAVDVGRDGAGTVTVTVELDREAATQLGDPKDVVVDDLRTAGWKVADPVASADGSVRFRATRAFSSPAQLTAVLAEVGGVDGVFRGTRLSVDDALTGTTYGFRTGVHLTGDPAQFGDDALTSALGGLPLGRTPAELAAMGATTSSAGTLVVSVDLPGDRPDTNGSVRAGRAVWRYPLTGGTATDAALRSTAVEPDGRTVTMLVVGGGLLVLAVVVGTVGLVRGRRRRAAA